MLSFLPLLLFGVVVSFSITTPGIRVYAGMISKSRNFFRNFSGSIRCRRRGSMMSVIADNIRTIRVFERPLPRLAAMRKTQNN